MTKVQKLIEMYPNTIEYKDNVLTVKNSIFYFPEINKFAIPVDLEIKSLREVDRETYEEWLKNPDLAVKGVSEEIADRIEYITGIHPYEIKIIQPKLTSSDVEEADGIRVFFGLEIPENLIDIFTLKALAYIAEDIREESGHFDTRFDFISEAIERGKEKLKEEVL